MHFASLRTMSGAVVLTLAISAVCPAATLHVPADYPTIQACIDAAVSGVDECVVAPGTYHETINFLGKAITLRSSGGMDVTTIDATGIGGSVVTRSSGEGPGPRRLTEDLGVALTELRARHAVQRLHGRFDINGHSSISVLVSPRHGSIRASPRTRIKAGLRGFVRNLAAFRQDRSPSAQAMNPIGQDCRQLAQALMG